LPKFESESNTQQTAAAVSAAKPQYLATEPRSFFMTVRDIGFWIRSSRADARMSRERHEHGAAAAFDGLYSHSADPYGAELPQYRYQQRKYDSLLSMLPQRRFQSVLDIGCGRGAFTRKLAPYSAEILGTDISEVAIAQARMLSKDHPNIQYSSAPMLEAPATEQRFDLIVLADTLYYTEAPSAERFETISHNIGSRLVPGGLLLLVTHYFFGVDPASRATRMTHDIFRANPELTCVAERRRAFFLATLLQRPQM
jgi:2-polyprenyl-3-methyl-5-hydroxy-6-metoxy-1,4-benzoquinol methylase